MLSPAKVIPTVLCSLSLALSISAQEAVSTSQSATIEQSRLFDRSGVTTRANVTADGMALPNDDSISNDDSFGEQKVLKAQPRVRDWIVSGDASLFYTSNVALTRRQTISDGFGVADAGVSWVPKINPELQLQVGIRMSIFRYFETSALDFENLGAGAGLAWTPPNLFGLSFFGRYDFTELIDKHSREILSDHEFSVGAQKTYAFGRSHSLSLGVLGAAGISDPFSFQRDQVGAFAGYHLQLTRKIDMDVLYRFGFYLYNKGDRRDANNVLSGNVAYHLTDWASLAAFVSFGDNRSNHSVFDYDVFTGGGGVAFSARF